MAASREPAPPWLQRRFSGWPMWVWVLIAAGTVAAAIALFIAGFTGAIEADPDSTFITQDDAEDDELAAVTAVDVCEEAVTARLVSPGTAAFTTDDPLPTASGFRVRGVVDSENGFGALLRSSFECEVSRDDEAGTVQVEQVTVL